MSETIERRIPLAAPILGEPEKQRVEAVIESGMIAAGDVVTEFEETFAGRCDAAHGVAAANGTAALHTALDAVGIGPGDSVVTTPFSFIATANAIKHCGARPLFADIDPETYNLDPAAVERVVTEHEDDVEAILAVHLYGLPAEMDQLRIIADRYDLALVEDAAQAHGARFRGSPVGSLGDVAAFSFYPTKNMTTGEGGMVVTDSEAIASRAASFVNHGRTADGPYEHARVGYNYRLTNLAAAIGLAQCDRLDEMVASRRRHAARFSETLADTDLDQPTVPDHVRHAYHQYTIATAERDRLVDHLDEAGIDTGVYYPTPIHEQPPYADRDVSLPAAERAAARVCSIPVHPGLDRADVRTIERALTRFNP